MAPGIGVPEVASRNNYTSTSRLPGLPVADVAATRRLERIHVRQLLVRHCFNEGSSNLGLQSVRNRSCRTYASPFQNRRPSGATLLIMITPARCASKRQRRATVQSHSKCGCPGTLARRRRSSTGPKLDCPAPSHRAIAFQMRLPWYPRAPPPFPGKLEPSDRSRQFRRRRLHLWLPASGYSRSDRPLNSKRDCAQIAPA